MPFNQDNPYPHTTVSKAWGLVLLAFFFGFMGPGHFQSLHAEISASTEDEQTPSLHTKDATLQTAETKPWLVAITPMGGFITNWFDFEYTVELPDLGEISHIKSFKDNHWGVGLSGLFVYHRFSLQSTTFYIHQINQSKVVGEMLNLSFAIPVIDAAQIVLGLDTQYYHLNTFFTTFEDSLEKFDVWIDGTYSDLKATHHLVYFFPKLGIQLRLPIQHWTLTPMFGCAYEYTFRRIQSGTGAATYTPAVDLPETLPKLNIKEHSDVYPAFIGLEAAMDYNQQFRLVTKFYYYAIINKIDIQVQGTVFFHPHVGWMVFFNYAQGITTDNLYVFSGPIIVF